MAFRLRAALRLAAMLLIVCSVNAARAEDPAPQPQPAATASPTPPGQKGGAARGGSAAPSPAAEQHRLPPDTTTRHTLALPGRTLNFTATAGSIRLFDGRQVH